MLVIIPNPNQMLQLVKVQKQLIKNNFSKDSLITRSLPLWIELPFAENWENLKTAANDITSIQMEKIIFEETKTSIEVSIIYKQKKEKVFLPLLNNQKTLQNTNVTELNFPSNIKIFRLGIKKTNPEVNSFYIQDFVWKKL